MKNPIEMLKEIKSVLGIELSQEVIETKLAQMMLENGTVLEAEEFAPEFEVFIVTEEDKIALPVGEYALEDGRILVVETEGLIKEIKEVSEEVVEEEVISEELAEEPAMVSKEEFDALKEMVKKLMEMLEPKEEVIEDIMKQEMSKPAAAPLKHSPEAEAPKKQIVFGANRPQSTKDLVMARISQIKK
jgi:hypothetical protein